MEIPKKVIDYCIKHNYAFNYTFTPNAPQHYFYITNANGMDVMDQGLGTTEEKALANFMGDFNSRRIKYKD